MATNLKGRQSDVFGKIAAINTLLDRYPVLTTTDPMLTNFSMNTSIGFLLSLLEVFGVTQADIINWICKIIGDGEDGVLTAIEYAVKGILLANIKNVFSCNFNPIIPDNLMRYAIDSGSRQDPNADFPFNPEKKTCIEINLQEIDLFGLLANCPSSEKGGIFYFDAFDPYRTIEIEEGGIVKTYKEPNYIPNELYKSKDFNAFLWYVINKGNIGSPTDKQKNTWDNRNKVYKKYEKEYGGSEELTRNFFKPIVGSDADRYKSHPKIPIYEGNTRVLDKEQYIICQYTERGANQAHSNVLNVWINADRYYRTRKFKAPMGTNPVTGEKEYHEFAINRTVFEFNYDYIFSLKLFDKKTLVANIVNSLLGLASSFSVSFSLEQKQLQKKVEAMVEKIMEQDDTEVAEDCFYTFDNATYQQMIDEVTQSYTGSYVDPLSPYATNYDDIYDVVGELGNPATKVGQSELLQRVIYATAYAANGSSGVTGGVEVLTSFKLGTDFIMDFIKQTVIQIVLQVLSPKVGILFAINSQILGDIGELSDWEKFMKDFDNLMKNIINSVKDIIVKELYNFMMEQLQPLLQLLIAKLALETIKYYKELIMNLIVNCIPNFRFGGDSLNTAIDNVNYADIILNTGGEAEQTTPEPPC